MANKQSKNKKLFASVKNFSAKKKELIRQEKTFFYFYVD
jgi:hypothetical protein